MDHSNFPKPPPPPGESTDAAPAAPQHQAYIPSVPRQVDSIHTTQFRPVSPKYAKVLIFSRLIGTVVGVGLTGGLAAFLSFVVVPEVSPFWAWLHVFWLWPAYLLISGIVRMIIAPRQVAAMGFAEREDDLLIKSGILFKNLTAVPYGRLQYLEVYEGPILRMVGLSNLSITTAGAGSMGAIHGIPVATAEELRERLTARGRARMAGL